MLFNGEIYDAFDHKAELEREGYRFRTATDTEVILALYEREGLERMLERLNGMFAIVIADTRRGAVHLLRDRVGIKPLYWAQRGTNGAVCVRSEGVSRISGVPRRDRSGRGR